MHLLPVVEGNRTFIEWKVQLDTAPQDADRWQTLFQSWIPDWTHSLERALDRLPTEAQPSLLTSSSSFGRAPPKILTPSGVRYGFNVSHGTKATYSPSA